MNGWTPPRHEAPPQRVPEIVCPACGYPDAHRENVFPSQPAPAERFETCGACHHEASICSTCHAEEVERAWKISGEQCVKNREDWAVRYKLMTERAEAAEKNIAEARAAGVEQGRREAFREALNRSRYLNDPSSGLAVSVGSNGIRDALHEWLTARAGEEKSG